MCGEKCYPNNHLQGNKGSPPRVRGKETRCRLRLPTSGITPACAGKSTSALKDFSGVEDHPRVCGEKTYTPPICAACCGSPPRVRGKVMLAEEKYVEVRITPACAGKRVRLSWMLQKHMDHPRVCGEKTSANHFCHPSIGSPPRVRGKD